MFFSHPKTLLSLYQYRVSVQKKDGFRPFCFHDCFAFVFLLLEELKMSS